MNGARGFKKMPLVVSATVASMIAFVAFWHQEDPPAPTPPVEMAVATTPSVSSSEQPQPLADLKPVPEVPAQTASNPPAPAEPVVESLPASEPVPVPLAETVPDAPPTPPYLDTLRMALQDLPCGMIDVAFQDGSVTVTGTAAGGDGLRSRIKAIVQDHVQDWPVVDLVRFAAPALCEPLSLLSPLRVANRSASGSVSIHLSTPDDPIRGGQDLVLDVVGPDFPAHLQVDYYTTDGNVVHLLPNPLEPSAWVEPRAVRRLGDRKAGGRFWSIGPPFGSELVVVVASASPLFPTPRPEAEAAAAYLPELKRALDTAGVTALADARFITTGAP
ncbi:DUF4384 domain-containing protein [Azospirillum sp. sgz302134]